MVVSDLKSGRKEAFNDGILLITMTMMELEIKSPEVIKQCQFNI